MEDYDVFEAFEKSIRRIYVEQDLVSLRFERDGDHSFAPHGVDLFDKYINTIKEDEPVVFEEDDEVLYFDRFQIFDDLVALSDQAIYFTAFLYLLTPLINNPLDHPLDLDGYATTMFPNRQNPAAKRFDFISDTLAEKTYAYWARLGNLLNRYLEEPLEPHAVDFSRVMEKFGSKKMSAYHENAGYKWLRDFKNKQQKVLNDKRRLIVHHQTGVSMFIDQHREAFTSREKMEVVMEERYSRPAFFKSYVNWNLEALDKSLDLIAALPPPPPPKVVKKKKKTS